MGDEIRGSDACNATDTKQSGDHDHLQTLQGKAGGLNGSPIQWLPSASCGQPIGRGERFELAHSGRIEELALLHRMDSSPS
jgi:hypothetical protein